MNNWYDHPKKCIAINMWSPRWYHNGIINIDIPAVAKRCHDAGADIVYMWQGWSQDHFGSSYYPTNRGPLHPNLATGKDHMQEFIDALHGYGIKVIGYYSYYDVTVWQRETDWREVDENGVAYTNGPFGELCPNSPYHDYVIARQTEVAERYDIDANCLLDGAAFNMGEHVCYCKYCQRKYKARFGKELPKFTKEWTPEWERYVKWKNDCMVELYDDLKAAHHRCKPGLPVTHLAFGCKGDREASSGMNYERVTATDTFVNSIAAWTDQRVSDGLIQRDPGFVWVAGRDTRYLRAISGKSVHMHIGRFMYDREFQSTPRHEMNMAVNSIVTAGGSPSIADNLYPDGTIDEAAYEMITDLYQQLGQKQAYLDYDRELKFVGLFYSKETLDYQGSLYPRENRYSNSFDGAYRFMTEHHVPFQVLANRDMTAEALKQFKVLVLTNAVVMTSQQVAAVREFVADGGKLLVTGSTSLVEENATMRNNFGLADVMGADYVNPSTYEIHYYDPEDSVFAKDIETRELVITRGDQVKVKLHDDAQAAGYLVMPASERNGRHRAVTYANDMHPETKTDYPAIIKHSYGKGECVYICGDAMHTYGIYGYRSMRQLIKNSLDYLVDQDYPVTMDAPRTVELAVYYYGEQMRIHMMNYAFDALRTISDTGGVAAESGLPTGKLTVHIACDGSKVASVKLASDESPLDYIQTNRGIDVTISSLNVHDIVVVDWKHD